MSGKNATGANEYFGAWHDVVVAGLLDVSAGQAVNDWAAVRFGKKWAENKFRDGSWVNEPPMLRRVERMPFTFREEDCNAPR